MYPHDSGNGCEVIFINHFTALSRPRVLKKYSISLSRLSGIINLNLNKKYDGNKIYGSITDKKAHTNDKSSPIVVICNERI